MAVGAEVPSLLASLIFDSDGACLSPTHAVKKGKRYRYYVSTALITGSRTDYPKGRRIPVGDIEGLVLDRLRALFASGEEMSAAIAPLGLDAATQRAVLDRSAYHRISSLHNGANYAKRYIKATLSSKVSSWLVLNWTQWPVFIIG